MPLQVLCKTIGMTVVRALLTSQLTGILIMSIVSIAYLNFADG